MGERIICELTSADIPGALGAMNALGADLWDVVPTGEMTVRFLAEKGSIPQLRQVLERRGDRLRLLRRLGLGRKLKPWLRHPVLLAAIGLLLLLTAWLPSRILFVQVEGNDRVPSNLILERAEECGIGFWSLRSQVRSEQVKNALLEALPQLQWAGINTSGCVATITVRERSPEPDGEDMTVSGIVASRDGIIVSCTVRRGTALCVPGQAVRAGEVLISGLTDCGLAIIADRAEGEIFAETTRNILVRTPESAVFRTGKGITTENFSLLIGKKRINFIGDSRILDTSCVKMYSEYYLTLPGGFQLPFGIAVETVTDYDTADTAVPGTAAVLEEYARGYLLSHMTAGQILAERTEAVGTRLFADYICLEMIGQNQYEEITKEYGENYGENG